MRGHAQYTAATSRQQETLPPPISDAVATRSNSRCQPGMDKMKSKYFLGLMALACADSSGPTQIPITATGAIQIVVATTSAGADVDADGYTLSIDAAQPQFIADNADCNRKDTHYTQYMFNLETRSPSTPASQV